MQLDLRISMGDGISEAIVRRPGAGGGPGVLLLMDALGLRPQIVQMTERIASWGYVVLAPNLFYREGSAAELAPTGDLRVPGERDDFFKVAGPRVTRLASEQVLSDLPTYLRALLELRGTSGSTVGVSGYCMGARVALRAASLFPDVVAAVGGFHGGQLVTDAPDSPHLGLSRSNAAFVFGHADNDPSMPPEQVAALDGALDLAGVSFRSFVYPGAQHGYTMADTVMYQEAGAERHYSELRDLFSSTLSADF